MTTTRQWPDWMSQQTIEMNEQLIARQAAFAESPPVQGPQTFEEYMADVCASFTEQDEIMLNVYKNRRSA